MTTPQRRRAARLARLDRVTCSDDGEVDEVVISGWLHLERMDDRQWWLSVRDAKGEHVIWITFDAKGQSKVTHRHEAATELRAQARRRGKA